MTKTSDARAITHHLPHVETPPAVSYEATSPFIPEPDVVWPGMSLRSVGVTVLALSPP